MFLLPGIICVAAAIVSAQGSHVEFLSDNFIAKLNQQGLPWQAGRNFPSNLTKSDIARMFGTIPAGGIPDAPKPGERRKLHDFGALGESIPAEFDARDHFKSCASIIGVVPDQGACASSYAFAVTGVASDRLCIHSNAKVRKLLSAQYVASCCKKCRYPETTVCASGISSYTWGFVHRRGLVTGGGYQSNIGCQPVSFPGCNHSPTPSSLPSCSKLPKPEPKCHTRCTNDNYMTGFFHDKTKFKKFYWLDEKPENIQAEILKNGPVLANMYIYTDLFSYKSGVYTISSLAELSTYASVKIIGWGVESGTPYWLITSTFGEQFGLKGLFKIVRGKDEAIIESLVNAALPRDYSRSGSVLGNGNEVEEPESVSLEEDEDGAV